MDSIARYWVIVIAGTCFAGSGCSGGGQVPPGKPAAIPAANAPRPNPVPAPIQPHRAPVPAAASGSSGLQNPATDVAAESLPPGPDDFEINSDQAVTELAGEFQEPVASVNVTALAPGLDSSTLEIVTAEKVDTPIPSAGSVSPRAASDAASASVNDAATRSINKPASRGTAPKEKDQAQEIPPEPTAAGWQLPARATAVAGSGTDSETGLPSRITLERDPVEMVLVPPGVFLEGIDGGDPQAGPQHSVLLEVPYYIDIFEVTVARHDAFRDFYRQSEGRRMDPAANHDGNPENPAVGIKYLDAKFYAKWSGKELPTEAQWERAARGNQGFSFPWGNGRPIWHQPREPGQLDPVGTFASDISPFGVYDMAGNAREWCLDLYSPVIYREDVAAGGSTVRNPAGPKTFQGTKRQVVKGNKTGWAVWQRAGQPQNEAAPDLGFRCVLNVLAAAKDLEKPTSKSSDKKK